MKKKGHLHVTVEGWIIDVIDKLQLQTGETKSTIVELLLTKQLNSLGYNKDDDLYKKMKKDDVKANEDRELLG